MISVLADRRDVPLAGFVVAALAALTIAPSADGHVTCFIRLQTGHACPGCGMSRAAGTLFNGDFAEAFAYHPYMFALVVQGLGIAVWRYRWGNRPLAQVHYSRLTTILLGNIAMVLAIWALRIVTGHIDTVY